MLVTNLAITDPTLVVIDGDEMMLEPGYGSSFRVASFSNSKRTYPFNVSVDRVGRISLSCGCPAALYQSDRSCKHERCAVEIISDQLPEAEVAA